MPRSRAATRLRIVESAYAMFYRQGFARVSMDEIAASAGVTKRTLYAHYDSKDSLLADVLEHHHSLALARIEKWADKLDPEDPDTIRTLFSELALWSAGRHWSGAGFTRLVMELADLPGHPRSRDSKAAQGGCRGAPGPSFRVRAGRRGGDALDRRHSYADACPRRPALRGYRGISG